MKNFKLCEGRIKLPLFTFLSQYVQCMDLKILHPNEFVFSFHFQCLFVISSQQNTLNKVVYINNILLLTVLAGMDSDQNTSRFCVWGGFTFHSEYHPLGPDLAEGEAALPDSFCKNEVPINEGKFPTDS